LFAYATLMVNCKSDASLNRIYNTPPRGLGERGWSTLRAEALKSAPRVSFGLQLFGDLLDQWVDAAVVQEVRCSLYSCRLFLC
jgi:hypothetical protein